MTIQIKTMKTARAETPRMVPDDGPAMKVGISNDDKLPDENVRAISIKLEPSSLSAAEPPAASVSCSY
jgi:hypothetical protein